MSDWLGNSIAFTLSREMALDHGLIEPTPTELAERNESSRKFHEQQQVKRVMMLAALRQLRGRDVLTDQLLDLHSGDTEADWGTECAGCDWSGCEGEPPEWPCRTVDLLMERHDIEWPSGSLPGKHYEGEFVPSDGKAFRPPTPRWHTSTPEADE